MPKFVTASGREVPANKVRAFGTAGSGLMVFEEEADAPIKAGDAVDGVVPTTIVKIKQSAEFVREVADTAPIEPFGVREQFMDQHLKHRATLLKSLH
jgi:hypothetical protein